MASAQEVDYHRSLLSPRYLDNLNPPSWLERTRRQTADVTAIRLRDPDGFEEHRKALAQLLRVPYRAGYMQVYVGDQGGQDHWVSGTPSDAQVAECMVPLYPPQGTVKSPTTGMVALPIVTFTRKAYIHGKVLQPVNAYEKWDQNFADYATPWELAWSALCRSGKDAFTPILDNSWTVIGYTGRVYGGPPSVGAYDRATLIVPADLLDLCHKSIQIAIDNGVPVFVHADGNIPPGWVKGHFYTTDDRIEVATGIDGEVLAYQVFNTEGLIHPWYSPLDFYCAAKVVVGLARLGVRVVGTLVRKASMTLEARSALRGATQALARDAAKAATQEETKRSVARAIQEADLRPLIRQKGKPSRVLSPEEMVAYIKETIRKRPYLTKLRSVTGSDGLLAVIKEWEKTTQKSFLKVTKGTPTRLGSEGVGGWALDAISGREVLIVEGEIFRNEARAVTEVTHELAYEAVREGPQLAMPHLDIPPGTGGLRNAMQWLEAVIQHGDQAYETLRSMGQPLTKSVR